MTGIVSTLESISSKDTNQKKVSESETYRLSNPPSKMLMPILCTVVNTQGCHWRLPTLLTHWYAGNDWVIICHDEKSNKINVKRNTESVYIAKGTSALTKCHSSFDLSRKSSSHVVYAKQCRRFVQIGTRAHW